MASLGDAFVDVRADTRQFSRDLDQKVTAATRGATTEMGRLGKATSAVGTAAKVALAGLAVGALAKIGDFAEDSIRAYSSLNESLNAVNVTFGENAKEVQALGRSAAQNLGLSNAEFNSFAVSVSAFTKQIAQGLGTEVPEVVDDLSRRISDFASVMDLDVPEAARIFRSALAGETEPIRKFGIDVSAATTEQVALAAGLADTASELSQSDKIQARYLAIMEQTVEVTGDFANTSDELANSLRIAAAEIENNKARAGEALVPFAKLKSELEVLGAQTLGVVATGFQVLFTDMTKAEGAINSFEILTGQTADTLEALVTLNKDTGISFEELAGSMNLTADASVPLTEGQQAFLAELGYTQDEIVELDRLLASEHAAALEAQQTGLEGSTDELGNLIYATDEASSATGELSNEVRTAAERLQEQHDAVRANIDPMFALRDATTEQADAQAAVNEAIAEYGAGSAEHLQAIADLSLANLDLTESADAVRINTDLTREAFVRQQVALGLTRQEAELLADEFARLEAFKFTDKTIRINEVRRTQSSANIGGRQHGGPVNANTPYWVGEAGLPELFVPRVPGTIVPQSNVTTGGVEAVFNISLSGGATRQDAVMIGDEVERRLRRLVQARVAS